MIGDIDESGLLPGLMKFPGAGSNPSENAAGMEKSFISLLKMIPVLSDITNEPMLVGSKVISEQGKFQKETHIRLIVVVRATASPLDARIEMCPVP